LGLPDGSRLRVHRRSAAGEALPPARLRGQGLLDADAVDRAWREHQSGQRDRTNELWTVLMLQAWLDTETATVPGSSRPVGAAR
jgi:asparagine synthase (glutamine-hydrolysing)